MDFLPVSQTGVTSSLFGKVCTQFQENRHTLILMQPSSIVEFNEVCKQFEEKPAVNFRSYFVYSIVVIAVYRADAA